METDLGKVKNSGGNSGLDSDVKSRERKAGEVSNKRRYVWFSRRNCYWMWLIIFIFFITTLLLVLIWYFELQDLEKARMIIQEKEWRVEEMNRPCSTRWVYLRTVVLLAGPATGFLCVLSLMCQKSKTDYEKRTEERLKEMNLEVEDFSKVLSATKKHTHDAKPVEVFREEEHDNKKDSLDSDLEISSDSDTEEELNQQPIKILELGSRLQKYWTVDKTMGYITSSAKMSQLCELTETGFDEVNKFLLSLEHPHIQKIEKVTCVKTDRGKQILITQTYWRAGSLRDLIHRVDDPMANWEVKYRLDSGRPLPREKVALYGSQILEALLYLSKQTFQRQRLRPLMQVQLGNVFIAAEDRCVLGGYENTVLGYRTSLYATLAAHHLLKFADVIMFGHVVYEMCTGKSLSVLIPTPSDYEIVREEYHEPLHYIFKRKKSGRLSHGIKKIKTLRFFLGEGDNKMKAAAKAVKSKAVENLAGAFHIRHTSSQVTKSGSYVRFRGRAQSAGEASQSDKGSGSVHESEVLISVEKKPNILKQGIRKLKSMSIDRGEGLFSKPGGRHRRSMSADLSSPSRPSVMDSQGVDTPAASSSQSSSQSSSKSRSVEEVPVSDTSSLLHTAGRKQSSEPDTAHLKPASVIQSIDLARHQRIVTTRCVHVIIWSIVYLSLLLPLLWLLWYQMEQKDPVCLTEAKLQVQDADVGPLHDSIETSMV